MIMSKSLKLSYIYMFIFSAIIIAWQTLSSLFNGVALNFVALLGLVFTILLMIFKDKEPTGFDIVGFIELKVDDIIKEHKYGELTYLNIYGSP